MTGLSLLVVLGLLTLTVLSLTSGLTEDAVVEVRLTSGGGWGRLGRLVPPDTPDPKWDPEPSQSELGRFDYAAVSVDSIPCSRIGKSEVPPPLTSLLIAVCRNIMLMGGNAIDSSIATMYCNTVVNSQSMGIGGGFIMTVYLANGTRVALIARETAPAAASKDMYHGDSNLTHYGWWSDPQRPRHCSRDVSLRSAGLRRARVRGGDVGTETEARQPRRVVAAAPPARHRPLL